MNRSNIEPLVQSQVHFGFGLDRQVDAHLQRAAALVSSKDDSLQALNEARDAAPEQLEVLTALYKFHFYRGDLEQAEQVVFQSLTSASRQGGFSSDWRLLSLENSDWSDPRKPGRAFLYSLKALAFIRLRQERADAAQEILATMDRLDPTDQVGADVIRELLNALLEERDD